MIFIPDDRACPSCRQQTSGQPEAQSEARPVIINDLCALFRDGSNAYPTLAPRLFGVNSHLILVLQYGDCFVHPSTLASFSSSQTMFPAGTVLTVRPGNYHEEGVIKTIEVTAPWPGEPLCAHLAPPEQWKHSVHAGRDGAARSAITTSMPPPPPPPPVSSSAPPPIPTSPGLSGSAAPVDFFFDGDSVDGLVEDPLGALDDTLDWFSLETPEGGEAEEGEVEAKAKVVSPPSSLEGTRAKSPGKEEGRKENEEEEEKREGGPEAPVSGNTPLDLTPYYDATPRELRELANTIEHLKQVRGGRAMSFTFHAGGLLSGRRTPHYASMTILLLALQASRMSIARCESAVRQDLYRILLARLRSKEGDTVIPQLFAFLGVSTAHWSRGGFKRAMASVQWIQPEDLIVRRRSSSTITDYRPQYERWQRSLVMEQPSKLRFLLISRFLHLMSSTIEAGADGDASEDADADTAASAFEASNMAPKRGEGRKRKHPWTETPVAHKYPTRARLAENS